MGLLALGTAGDDWYVTEPSSRSGDLSFTNPGGDETPTDEPRPDWRLSDDVITIRPPRPGDSTVLIAGRDDEWRRWLGPGSDVPQPTACILVDDNIVGWVDFDTDREWLGAGEVNMGYNVFAPYRRQGYASRAVLLLLRHLALTGRYRTATLSIEGGNDASLAVAAKAGFDLVTVTDNGFRFARPISSVEAG
jgi:RimJ/RimL family protein N-acetyltransferase